MLILLIFARLSSRWYFKMSTRHAEILVFCLLSSDMNLNALG